MKPAAVTELLKLKCIFLPDVYVPCEVCHGKRYNRETLEVKYKGKNISDILDMTVEEGVSFFENIPKIKRKIQTLFDVGLGYMKLGQPATTLSGGEAQRVKLASELHRRSTGRSFYILDEPTTGLHVHDIARLLEVFSDLWTMGIPFSLSSIILMSSKQRTISLIWVLKAEIKAGPS